ncbi:MAG TPA: alpha-amylase family glycosyl hydrolase [Nitrolancea sp.]|nr:alpha-amylase family glycosyl hydrolase [Nitrolancea sp.]
MMTKDLLWWQRGIIYQIYPRSFMDSNGDGVGDLAGITSKLDYLAWLGIDAIWLSPISPSPMVDFGYDVADYTGIDPTFGTLDDFDALLREAHRHEIRVIFDFVPNHSSDQHPWFVESRSSRDNPKRDWYVWSDPRPGGGPPNNWLSSFGGSAWTWDATTEQYYFHEFFEQQPDLNWRNPEVRQAMFNSLRFWLDRGVDGFRLDAVWHLMKDERLRDNPPNPNYLPSMTPYNRLIPAFNSDRPEMFEVLRQMREVADEYDERLLIGELYLPIERLVAYYGPDGDILHLPHNFHLMRQTWDALHIGAVIDFYEGRLPNFAWPNWVMSNHDNPRLASRIGAGQARVAAMMLLTLRGTPTLYYADELGMLDVAIPSELIQDPEEHTIPGLHLGRDPERTPMQWDASPNAGFTSGTPWLPVGDDYSTLNVVAQRDDPRSMLTMQQRLITLRRAEPALITGGYAPLRTDGDLLAYTRELDGAAFLIVLNLGHDAQEFAPPSHAGQGRMVLNTHLDRENEPLNGQIALRGDEGVVIRLQPPVRQA